MNAIKTFEKFQDKLESIKTLQIKEQFEVVEAAVGTFSRHCEETLNHTFEAINSKLKQKLLDCLKEMNWPKLKHNQEISFNFRDTFLMMTRLRVPNAHSRPILSSFSCLALHHQISFKYHFFGKKETNNAERPEFYLSYILNIIQEQEPFLVGTLQPILEDANLKFIALHEYIAALNELVFEKLERDKAKNISNARITLEQLLNYDNSLSELYLYNLHECSSCVSFFLADKSLTQQWLDMEQSGKGNLLITFCLDFNSQLENILSAENYLQDAYSYTKDDINLDYRISKSAEFLSILFIDSKNRYIYLPKGFRKILFNIIYKHGFSSYLEKLKLPVRKLQTSFYPVNDSGATKGKDFLDVCFSINSIIYIQSLLWGWSCDSVISAFLLITISTLCFMKIMILQSLRI